MATKNCAKWTEKQARDSKENSVSDPAKCKLMLQETQEGSDTEDVEKLIWLAEFAYHEAGHTVVALATGMGVREVCITPERGYVKSEECPFFLFDDVEPHDVAKVRSAIVFYVAGEVAAAVRNYLECYDAWPECLDVDDLVSRQFQRDEHNPDERKDVDCAVQNAWVVWKSRALRVYRREMMQWETNPSPLTVAPPFAAWLFAPPDEGVLKELVRAERQAEKVLKRYWAAVEKLAQALLRRQSGRMTGKQVRQLIGEVEAPALRKAS